MASEEEASLPLLHIPEELVDDVASEEEAPLPLLHSSHVAGPNLQLVLGHHQFFYSKINTGLAGSAAQIRIWVPRCIKMLDHYPD